MVVSAKSVQKHAKERFENDGRHLEQLKAEWKRRENRQVETVDEPPAMDANDDDEGDDNDDEDADDEDDDDEDADDEDDDDDDDDEMLIEDNDDNFHDFI
jgi:hypothetical protein